MCKFLFIHFHTDRQTDEILLYICGMAMFTQKRHHACHQQLWPSPKIFQRLGLILLFSLYFLSILLKFILCFSLLHLFHSNATSVWFSKQRKVYNECNIFVRASLLLTNTWSIRKTKIDYPPVFIFKGIGSTLPAPKQVTESNITAWNRGYYYHNLGRKSFTLLAKALTSFVTHLLQQCKSLVLIANGVL